MIIGVCGPFASGKDTMADYLTTKGFAKISSGDILRIEAQKVGIETTRKNLQELGTKLKAEKGGDILIKLGLDDPTKDTIIVGLRHPDEIKFLRKYENFYLVNVTASRKVRYKRAVERNKLGDNIKSFEDFAQGEDKELNQQSGGQLLSKTIAMADEVIDNVGAIEQLHKKTNELLEKLRGKFNETSKA